LRRGGGVSGQPLRVANGTDKDGKEQFLTNALPDKEATDEVVAQLEKAKWRVRSVEKKERRPQSSAPYTTSKLAAGCIDAAGLQRAAHDGRGAAFIRSVEIGNEARSVDYLQ